jgi:hypothetical protein
MDDAIQFKILVLGENHAGWVGLQKQLEKRGCRCWFARSAEEALALNGARDYDLILSSISVSQIDTCLSDLGGFQANVFYCHPVEDGCWWLPIVRHGQKCFGAPGVRGREFMGVLEQIIRDRSAEPVVSDEPKPPFTSAGRG